MVRFGSRRRTLKLRLGLLALTVFVTACGDAAPDHAVIPLPAFVELVTTDTFHVTEDTRITYDSGDLEAERIGRFLAGWIGNTVETTPAVVATGSLEPGPGPAMGPAPGPSIHLTTRGSLWSETMGCLSDIKYLVFPRLAGVAELGWSPADAREWTEYRQRVGRHGARWTALGVNFQHSELIDWTLEL